MPKLYTRNTWTDEVLAGAERYNISGSATNLSDVSIQLSTAMTATGTLVNASRMNNIENGIDAIDNQLISGSYVTGTYTYFGDPAYISGLNIGYNTSGSVSVSPGTAYVPGAGRLIYVTGTISAAMTPVATNVSGTWQHVYLYNNSGVATAEVSATAPSNPYNGVARTKTGDTSRRYIGSVYCDQGGYLYHWNSEVQGNVWKLNWLETITSFPFAFANVSGTVTTPTVIQVSWLVPSATQRLAIELIVQTAHSLAAGGDNVVSITDGNDDISTSVQAEVLSRFGNNAASVFQLASVPVKISGTTLKYTHLNTAGTNGAFFRARGITIQR